MEEKKFVLKRINGGGSVGIYETEGGPTVYMYSEAPTIEVTIRPVKSKRELRSDAVDLAMERASLGDWDQKVASDWLKKHLEAIEAIDREDP